LAFAKKNHFPMIARETYIKKSVSEFAKEGRQDAYDEAFVQKHYQYPMPKNKDLKTVTIYPIRDKIFDPLMGRYGTIRECSCHLCKRSGEKEIYQKHAAFYFQQKQLNLELFDQSCRNRWKKMIAAQQNAARGE